MVVDYVVLETHNAFVRGRQILDALWWQMNVWRRDFDMVYLALYASWNVGCGKNLWLGKLKFWFFCLRGWVLEIDGGAVFGLASLPLDSQSWFNVIPCGFFFDSRGWDGDFLSRLIFLLVMEALSRLLGKQLSWEFSWVLWWGWRFGNDATFVFCWWYDYFSWCGVILITLCRLFCFVFRQCLA